jgi:uncharacterized surface anchored protein
VVVTSVLDTANKPLGGACVELRGATPVPQACDNETGDADPTAGSIDIENVPPGDYTLVPTRAPDGYQAVPSPAVRLTVPAGGLATAQLVFQPIAAATATPQATPSLPPPLPAPSQVSIIGSFQQALGCPQNNDPTCAATASALIDNQGVWIGSFAIPAGQYTYRVFAHSDQDRSLGAHGDPAGADLPLTVPADATTVYFTYDSHTGSITATPTTISAIFQAPFSSLPMQPLADGSFELFVDAPSGDLNFQVLFNDQPVTTESLSLDQASRLHLVFDNQGTITTLETVTPSALSVTKTAADGAPMPDACFAVLNRDGATLLGQACDGDDNQRDGQIRIPFPNGITPGSYLLRETRTPDGQPAAPDQEVTLAAGDNQINAVAEATVPASPAAEGAIRGRRAL